MRISNEIISLPDCLNKISQKIKSTINSQNIDDAHMLESILNQHIPHLQFNLQERHSFFDNYKKLMNNTDTFRKQLKETTVSYSAIQRQALISSLVLHTRIYDKCTFICYLLNNPQNTSHYNSYASDFLLPIKPNNHISRFNAKTNKNYIKITRDLKNKFGYYLAIIIFLRNQFTHEGNTLEDNDVPIFDSDQYKKLETNSIEQLHLKIQNKYLLHKLPEADFNILNNNQNFGIILDRCNSQSDKLFGTLMDEIFLY